MSIKLTIEPTAEIVLLDAGPCRLWRGVTANGGEVFVFIAFVALADSAPATDREAFDAELTLTKAPTAIDVIIGGGA